MKDEEYKQEAANTVIWAKVPPTLRRIIEDLAEAEDRTVSKTVRRLLEQSPPVKDRLPTSRAA